MITVKPSFYDRFKCIADACTDTCCKGWVIDVSSENMQYYRGFEGLLGEKIKTATKGYKSKCFIQNDGACPFLTSNGLCEICIEKGTDALREPCSLYPRFVSDFGLYKHVGMHISCPVVADFVLESDTPLTFETVESDERITCCNDIDAGMYMSLKSAYDKLMDIAGCGKPLSQKISALLYTALQIEKGITPDFTMCLNIDLSKFSPKAFSRLEYLNINLSKHFTNSPRDDASDIALSNLLRYLIHTYFLNAAFDGKVFEKAAFITGYITSVLYLDIPNFSVAVQKFAKEIEHSDRNIKRFSRYWRRFYGRKIKL